MFLKGRKYGIQITPFNTLPWIYLVGARPALGALSCSHHWVSLMQSRLSQNERANLNCQMVNIYLPPSSLKSCINCRVARGLSFPDQSDRSPWPWLNPPPLLPSHMNLRRRWHWLCAVWWWWEWEVWILTPVICLLSHLGLDTGRWGHGEVVCAYVCE